MKSLTAAHKMQPEIILSRLPVPEIREETLQHSYKQGHRREDANRLRPPKLKTRYDSNFNSFNRDRTAHAISFRGNEECTSNDSSLLSSYDCSSNETYFEQCFTKICKLGEGSFGEVFKVRSKEDGLLYAVKMSKQLYRSELYRQERLEEVRRYEQFSGHANCLKFYRAWEQDDRLYMQMELCRESLECYLARKRKIAEEKVWSILLDLLLALKSLHDRNLIHLDIKLDNVLIGDDDICKLADFGLVIDINRANRNQATEGDSRYVAPEIMQGHFSKSADIFSLGIAMLELSCFLELPANGLLWQQLRSGVLPEDFLKPISVELQMIIKQMMTPDWLQRPTVDDLLAHKKLITIMQRRSHWELVNKFKQTIRECRRLAWSKLCNLRFVIFRLFVSLLVFVGVHKSHLYNKKIDSTELVLDDNENGVNNIEKKRSYLLSSTPIGTSKMKARIDLQFKNSTPVNFRSRKDLTKTSFIENNDDDSFLGKSSFTSMEDFDSDSLDCSRKPSDISSIRIKLFSKLDEDFD